MSNPYQRSDRFTKKARSEGYAARSVYKLDAIDRKLGVLRRGQRVVDLGAFPGSWSKYALERIGEGGRLVGVDLEEPRLSGATFLVRSVFEVEPDELIEALGGPADVLLSDMAPKTTGDRFADHCAQIELARRALEIAVDVLAPGGAFVCKVFEGEDAPVFEKEVRARFERVKRVRPEAVRKQSRELFMVGTGFRAAGS